MLQGAPTDHLVADDWLIDRLDWLHRLWGWGRNGAFAVGVWSRYNTGNGERKNGDKVSELHDEGEKDLVPVCGAWGCNWFMLCCDDLSAGASIYTYRRTFRARNSLSCNYLNPT